MVNTTAYFVYQLNATDGIRFSVTSVPNTPTLKIHVYSNKQVTQNIDLNLTPADNLALYNNAVKVLTGQFYLVNSGNTNLGTNTSAAVVISYSPYTSTYTFYNPGVWTGSQSIGFFDAMIVWIREKL